MADYNSAYTGVQIDANLAKAATAVQPAGLATVATTGAYTDLTGSPSLATVATTGAYTDLSGRPTLGTAAATASTDYATAAQGAKADTSVQSVITGITGADAITNTVSLTAAEYAAIGTKSATTLYIIAG